MRIISGKYRGHQLVAFKADHIRPTTDRVKETLFNKLMFRLDGARVADLFCGTGNLGIEALSRDASFCTFVEKNPRSIAITRQNIEKLKVPSSEYKIINMDVLGFLKSYSGEAFDIILADPPFTEKMAHAVLEAAHGSAAFGVHTILAIESEQKERLDDTYGDVVRYDKKSYGDKFLSMFCHKEALAQEAESEEEETHE
ncbi:Ribosomal RNA small subunit methyltransferase D [compost metagenome]